MILPGKRIWRFEPLYGIRNQVHLAFVERFRLGDPNGFHAASFGQVLIGLCAKSRDLGEKRLAGRKILCALLLPLLLGGVVREEFFDVGLGGDLGVDGIVRPHCEEPMVLQELADAAAHLLLCADFVQKTIVFTLPFAR
jgi:hypothetical protein